jgi:hypothetical protein
MTKTTVSRNWAVDIYVSGNDQNHPSACPSTTMSRRIVSATAATTTPKHHVPEIFSSRRGTSNATDGVSASAAICASTTITATAAYTTCLTTVGFPSSATISII